MSIDNSKRDAKFNICLKKDVLTIPNIISIFRIILIVPCVYFLLVENYILTAVVLVFSGLSDMFDGMIARNLGQITKLGQILDPIADKLTLGAVVFCLSIKFNDIIPIAGVLIVKDFIMLIAGIDLINKGISPPPAKWYGKLATIFFYVSAIIIIGQKAFLGASNLFLTFFLLGVTAFMMLYALIRYFLVYLKLVRDWKDK